MPSYHCFLCATDEGVFLDITGDNGETFRDHLETCLLLKLSENKISSGKICHKCAYELQQCNSFLDKYRRSRQGERHNFRVQRPYCSLCLDHARKEYLFDLADGNHPLNNPTEKLNVIFGDKVSDTDKSSLICLKCRYLLDVLSDLQSIFQATSAKLQSVRDGKINYLSFPKINTTVASRKTTTTEFKRLAISTPSNSDSDTGSMTRGRPPNNRVNSKSSQRSRSQKACDKCRSAVEAGGDMYRFYRTGLTVCKSCWLTRDPSAYRFKRKSRRDSAETRLCSVFLKDVLMDEDPKSQKAYRVEVDGEGNKVFIVTDESSGSENKTRKDSAKGENDEAAAATPRKRKQETVGRSVDADVGKKKRLAERRLAATLESEGKDVVRNTRLRNKRGASDTEVRTTAAEEPRKQGRSDTEVEQGKGHSATESEVGRYGRRKLREARVVAKNSQRPGGGEEGSTNGTKKKRGRKRKEEKLAEERARLAAGTDSGTAFGIETRGRKRRKSSKDEEVVAYVDLVEEEEKEEEEKRKKEKEEEEENGEKEEEVEEGQREKEEEEEEEEEEERRRKEEEVEEKRKKKGEEEEEEEEERAKKKGEEEEEKKKQEEEKAEGKEGATAKKERERAKEKVEGSYPCAECGVPYRNKLISMMHRMKHYKQLALRLDRLREKPPAEEIGERVTEGGEKAAESETEEHERASEDGVVINVVDDEEESLRPEEAEKDVGKEREETAEGKGKDDSVEAREIDGSPRAEATEKAGEGTENGVHESVIELAESSEDNANGEALMEDESSVKSLRLSKDSKDSRRESRESRDFNEDLEEKGMEDDTLQLDSGDHEVPTASPRESEEKEREETKASEGTGQNGLGETGGAEGEVEMMMDTPASEKTCELELSAEKKSGIVADRKVEDDEDEEVDVEGDAENLKESSEVGKDLAETAKSGLEDGREEERVEEVAERKDDDDDVEKSAKGGKENLDVLRDPQSPRDSASAAKEVLKEVFELATAELEKRHEDTARRNENAEDEETLENISREVHSSADMPSLDPIVTGEANPSD